MTDSQSVTDSRNPELTDFMELPKRTDLTEKFELPEEEEKKRKRSTPAPWPTPFYKLGRRSQVWNICTGQLGVAAWLCSLPSPAHLLIS